MTKEEFETEHNCKQCRYYFEKDPYTPGSEPDCHWEFGEDEEDERPCERGGKEC